MIKHFDLELYPALAVGILCGVLIGQGSRYFVRTAAITLPLALAVVTLLGLIFSFAWQYIRCRASCLLFSALLLYAGALEILTLWQLYAAAYDGKIPLLVVAVAVLLPGLYLRRKAAITQTANAVLVLLVLAGALLVLSVLPRLRIYNLQTAPMDTAVQLRQTVCAQLRLPPELLLAGAYLAKKQKGIKKRTKTVFRLSLLFCATGFGVTLLLELFYGAAAQYRSFAMHTVAACGALSIFNRMEWLQLLLWTLAVAVKTALLLYAARQLLSAQGNDETVGVRCYGVFVGCTLLLCTVLKDTDLLLLKELQVAATMLGLLFAAVGGAIICIIQKGKACT